MDFEKSLLPRFVWWYPFAPAVVGVTTFVLGLSEEDVHFLGIGIPVTLMFFMIIWGASFLVAFIANVPGRAILKKFRSRAFLAVTLSTLTVSSLATASVALFGSGSALLRGVGVGSGFALALATIGGAAAVLWLIDLRKRAPRAEIAAPPGVESIG